MNLFRPVERPPACPLFVELCAGTAAISIRLQGGPNARPPVSRMGAKTGYANAILAACGLSPGAKAAAYLWCEPDDGCRSLLMAYCLPDVRREAAEIIRSWAGEDPRALWERLKAEGPIRGASGRDVAKFCVTYGWGNGGISGTNQGWNGGWSGPGSRPGKCVTATQDDLAARLDRFGDHPTTLLTPDARPIDPHEVARWLRIITANRLINVDSKTWANTGEGGSTFGGDEFCTPVPSLASAAEQVPGEWPAVVVAADGRVVDPREVAKWMQIEAWSNSGRYMGPDRPSSCHPPGWVASITSEGVAARVDALPANVRALITDDARPLMPVDLPPGTVVVIDGPYRGTTPYSHALDWYDNEHGPGILTLAKRWADAGALVVICEAVPLGTVVHEGIAEAEAGPLEGWCCYEITGQRVGQKRTFSKQQREWITMSRPADPEWAAGLAMMNHADRVRAARAERAVEQFALFGATA